jgi:hypothetical protein
MNYFNINLEFLKNVNFKIDMAKLNDQMIENGNTILESVTEPEVESNTQVFDFNSDYWNQIFEEDPTPEKLFET